MSSQDNINGLVHKCPANSTYQDYTRSSRLYDNNLANHLKHDNSIDLNDPETYKNYLLNNANTIRMNDNKYFQDNYKCQYNL